MPKNEPVKKYDHAGHRARCRKRLLSKGGAVLSELDLLEMLLFYAIPRADTRKTAQEMLDRFGSIEGILNSPKGEIAKIKGLGDSAEALFMLLRETVKREGDKFSGVCRLDDESVKNYLLDLYKDMTVETVYALYFSKEGKLVGKQIIFHGTINSVRFSLRSITEGAIRAGGNAVILAHNHPSGSLIPSTDDILSTKRMAMHLAANEIDLVEHYIVGKDECVGILKTE
ncbi:MAG: RadC family protein [Clostridia bacterium]|nr:RadC family protein [Clostridia bacterium]